MGEKVQVVKRREEVYGRNTAEVYEYYNQILGILDDMGFDEIKETRTEAWKSLPMKPDIEAYRYKDPFTRIRIKIKTRVKSPRPNRMVSKDTRKARFIISGFVERKEDPEWGYFESSTFFGKIKPYQWLKNQVLSYVQKSVLDGSWGTYLEEAEETAIEVASRLRQSVGSPEAIGRGKREAYSRED